MPKTTKSLPHERAGNKLNISNAQGSVPLTPQGFIAAANNLRTAGISSLPINNKKNPIATDSNGKLAWKFLQERYPTTQEINSWSQQQDLFGIAEVTGKISGNLEVVDIDCKYDLTGTLWNDYCNLIKEHSLELFEKLVIAKTINGGYHILFRSSGETVEGNQKLAQRPANDEERQAGKKVKVLIETRGEGGYAATNPTPGYEFIQGDLSKIPLLTKEERALLLTIARSFDEMPVKEEPERAKAETKKQPGKLSPFDDYNDRADIATLLEEHGWKFAYQQGERRHYQRPGETNAKTSANWHEGLRTLYVFSTSTEFEAGRGYNSTGVYTQLVHNGDYSAASNALYEAGYGSRRAKKRTVNNQAVDDEDIRLTDVGNARCLKEQHGENLKFVPKTKEYFCYTKTHWDSDETELSQTFAQETAASLFKKVHEEKNDPDKKKKLKAHAIRSNSDKGIKAMLSQVRNLIAVRPNLFDQNPLLTNCLNGTFDCQSDILREHRREDYITKIIRVNYNKNAQAPVFLQFLNRIFNGDQELIKFIQRAIGYTLTGLTGEQCVFILYGSGANGKTRFLEILRALMGDYAAHIPTESLMLKTSGSNNIPSEIADLRGARLVTATETNEGQRLNESLIKQLTGEDTVKARQLYAKWFEFIPEFKLWLAANHKPSIQGTDRAIWRRVYLIPFEVTIPDHERDKQLGAKLKAELEGIFAWAVEGCREYLQRGLDVPAKIRRATDEYKAEMDVIGEFLEERCQKSDDNTIESGQLYTNYKQWCEESGEQYLTKKSFGMRLNERGFQAVRAAKGVRKWKGLTFNSKLSELTQMPEDQENQGFSKDISH